MSKDGLLDLRESAAHGSFLPEKRQRSRIVTKQQHALLRFQGGEGSTNLRQMRLAQSLPILPFVRQGFRFIDRKRQERGRDAQQNIVASFALPERLQRQFPGCAMPTGQAKAAFAAKQAHFAQLVVADNALQFGAEAVAELAQALARALEGGVIAQANEPRVAGIIAIGDCKIGPASLGQKSIQQVVMSKWIAQPDVMAIGLDGAAEQRIEDDARFVAAPLLFRLTGVMNVADNQDGSSLRHDLGRVLL